MTDDMTVPVNGDSGEMMVERIADFIGQWNMIGPADRVILGVSGGADSVCLCLVLHELSGRIGFALRVVHVEHGIRGAESERDAAFVERLCEGLGLACTVRRVDVPAYAYAHHMGEEEAARFLRYQVFDEEAQAERRRQPDGQGGRIRIALAHHMEDNAETMLFHLARGTGLDGLCGMQPVRADRDCACIRPLLAVSRQEIEAFLAQKGQAYCQDSTNRDPAYSRNRIRLEVMPGLAAVNAKAVAHMNRTAERLGELRSYLEAETDRVYAQTVERRTADGSCLCLHKDRLDELPKVLGERVIHRAIREAAGTGKDIAAVHIQSVQKLFEMQCGSRIDLPHQVSACRVYEGVGLRRRKTPGTETDGAAEGARNVYPVGAKLLADCACKGAAAVVPCGEGGAKMALRVFPYEGNKAEISTKMYTKWFDYDKIKDGFSIRSRENGDYFVMDEAGHRKKLERYFIDQKIPLEQRDCTLLLAREKEVLWVIGGRMGRGGMITEGTRTILEVAYQP